MSCRIARPTSHPGNEPEASVRLRSLILYDEAGSGKRAMQTLRSVSHILDNTVSMDVRLWRLDLLRDPALNDAANSDATGAMMLVVSVRHADRLPRSDHRLLANFFRQARWSNAMVVALVNDPAIQPAVLNHSLADLRQETRRAGLEFLGCSAGLPTRREPTEATSSNALAICGTLFRRARHPVSTFCPGGAPPLSPRPLSITTETPK